MTPEEIKTRHDQSVADYPGVNISENEYVIAQVRRHPIALAPAFGAGFLVIALAFALLFNYSLILDALGLTDKLPKVEFLLAPILLLIGLVVLLMYISYYIYTRNYFILTNECVTENMQYTLLSHREQTISLGSIEDSSFTQDGILQYMLNYGSIRLSTIGDEDTYRFQFVSDPKNELKILSDAVENFKNNRANV